MHSIFSVLTSTSSWSISYIFSELTCPVVDASVRAVCFDLAASGYQAVADALTLDPLTVGHLHAVSGTSFKGGQKDLQCCHLTYEFYIWKLEITVANTEFLLKKSDTVPCN